LPSNVSDTQVNKGGGHLGAKFGEEEVGRYEGNFKTIYERQGAVEGKEIEKKRNAKEIV